MSIQISDTMSNKMKYNIQYMYREVDTQMNKHTHAHMRRCRQTERQTDIQCTHRQIWRERDRNKHRWREREKYTHCTLTDGERDRQINRLKYKHTYLYISYYVFCRVRYHQFRDFSCYFSSCSL